MVAVACFLPGRAKDLSATPRIHQTFSPPSVPHTVSYTVYTHVLPSYQFAYTNCILTSVIHFHICQTILLTVCTLPCCVHFTLLFALYPAVCTSPCCVHFTLLFALYPDVCTLPCCLHITLLYALYPAVCTLHCCVHFTLLFPLYPAVSILPRCMHFTLLCALYPAVCTLPCCLHFTLLFKNPLKLSLYLYVVVFRVTKLVEIYTLKMEAVCFSETFHSLVFFNRLH